jgi:hypothetical protein
MAAMPDGGAVVAGEFDGSIDLGDGERNGPAALLWRINGAGETVWTRAITSDDPDPDLSVIDGLASDGAGRFALGGYLVEAFDLGNGLMQRASERSLREGFIAMYEADGALAWARRFASTGSSRTLPFAFAANGDLWANTEVARQVDFGPGHVLESGGQTDLGLIRLDGQTGETRSAQIWGGDGYQFGTFVLDPESGALAMAGRQGFGVVDFGDHRIEGRAYFLVRFDAEGSLVSSQAFPVEDEPSVGGVAFGADGAVIAALRLNNGDDLGAGPMALPEGRSFVATSFDRANAVQWTRSFQGGPRDSRPRYFAVDPGGNIAMAIDLHVEVIVDDGQRFVEDRLGGDVLLMEVNSAGQTLRARVIGTEGSDTTNGFARASDQSILIAGRHGNIFEFDPRSNHDDFVVARYSPCWGAGDVGECVANEGAPCSAGVGACVAQGAVTCVGGCNAIAGDPGVEACNELDDDCDGTTDEGVLNPCGQCGDVPAEVCNEQDDDCDGEIDEDLPLNACGECGDVPPETCNGRDDDCDDNVDENIDCSCPLSEFNGNIRLACGAETQPGCAYENPGPGGFTCDDVCNQANWPHGGRCVEATAYTIDPFDHGPLCEVQRRNAHCDAVGNNPPRQVCVCAFD